MVLNGLIGRTIDFLRKAVILNKFTNFNSSRMPSLTLVSCCSKSNKLSNHKAALSQVGVLTMLLCFFILWLSFTANVNENSW